MSECLVVSYTKMLRKKVRPILSYLSFEDSIQIIIDFLCIPPMLPTQSDDNLVTLVEKNNG